MIIINCFKKLAGFADGNGSRYGAKYFMDEDAVMVTFQYR